MTKKSKLSISDVMDKEAFDIISKESPSLIEEMRAAIRDGLTARQIEARLLKKFNGTKGDE